MGFRGSGDFHVFNRFIPAQEGEIMPDHKTHHLVCKLILGKARPDVDRYVDEPYRWLGAKHRILRHDPISLFVKYHDDPEGFFAGMLHILTDFGVSEAKRKKRVRKNVKSKRGRKKNKRYTKR